MTFYDYTKRPYRVVLPDNYTLTFSLCEDNRDSALGMLASGRCNIAVVFRANGLKHEPLPTSWRGYKVVDGDETDLRFLDPAGVVVGLRCKGVALKDTSGFVQDFD